MFVFSFSTLCLRAKRMLSHHCGCSQKRPLSNFSSYSICLIFKASNWWSLHLPHWLSEILSYLTKGVQIFPPRMKGCKKIIYVHMKTYKHNTEVFLTIGNITKNLTCPLFSSLSRACPHFSEKEIFVIRSRFCDFCIRSSVLWPSPNKKKNFQKESPLSWKFPLYPPLLPVSEAYWLFSFLALGKNRNSKTQVSWLSKNRTRLFLLVCFGGCLHYERSHMGNWESKERTLSSWLRQLQSDKLQAEKMERDFTAQEEKSLGFLLACRWRMWNSLGLHGSLKITRSHCLSI